MDLRTNIPLVGAMLSKSSKWLVTASLLVTVWGTSVSEAQVTGTISGYVKDPSGAAVPTVNITAVQVERQITRQASGKIRVRREVTSECNQVGHARLDDRVSKLLVDLQHPVHSAQPELDRAAQATHAAFGLGQRQATS